MTRRIAIALVTIAALARPALADNGGFIMPPVVKVVATNPAEPPRRPLLQKIFGRKLKRDTPFAGPAFDTTIPPKGLLPPPPPPAPLAPLVEETPVAASHVVKAVEVPLPRLRPPRSVAAAGSGDGKNVVAASVSYEVTASIPEPPQAATTAAATATPSPPTPPVKKPRVVAPAAKAPVPPPVLPPPVEVAEQVQGDDLLGDVTTYFPPESHDMDPEISGAATLDMSLPPGGAKAVRGAPRVNMQLPAQPYEMVRTLQAMQDQIAQGSVGAAEGQRSLRSEIEARFAAADPSVWQLRQNAEAAVTYVLSGGSPAILERLAALDPKPSIDMRLVTGVLAYAKGKEAEAANDLGAISPLSLPASMGAQMAIAQSAIAVRTNPEKAMQLLSTARLLAPGTLVEEAALRRQLFVANQLKADAMVESLARQYLDRFRHSVYAGNFRQRFAAAISRMDMDSEEKFARLDDMLSAVEPEARCHLFLTVALASAIKSRFVAAKLAADRAMALASPASNEEARARLYHAAALAADAKAFDTGVENFAGVDRNLLGAGDRDLYDTVSETIAGIQSGTDRAAMPEAAMLPPEDPANDKPAPLVARATDAVKAVDELLQVAQQ